MPTIPPEVYGPAGLLVFLIVAVWRLWRLHEQEDARRDSALDLLVKQLPELISSNHSMAETISVRLSVADKGTQVDDDGKAGNRRTHRARQ